MIKYDIDFDKELIIKEAHPKIWRDKTGLSEKDKDKTIRMILSEYSDIAYAFTLTTLDYSIVDAYGVPEILKMEIIEELRND